MKTFKVQSPDGIVEVQADDNATDAQLVALAQKQQAQVVKPNPTTSERLQASIPGRFLKGWKDPVDAGAQMATRAGSGVTSAAGYLPNALSDKLDASTQNIDQDISDSEREYQTARWKTGQSGFDGARTAGNILNPATYLLSRRLPGGATSTAGRAVQGAVAGTVGGVLRPVTDTSQTSFGMQKTGQGMMGGLGGAVAAPIIGRLADFAIPLAIRLANKFKDPNVLGARASIVTDEAIHKIATENGMDPATIPRDVLDAVRQQVLEGLKGGTRIDAASTIRKMDFAAQGVPALRGQITRDPSQYSGDMNLRGVATVGEPVQNLLNAQNTKITSDIAKFGGPRAQEAYPAGSLMTGSLKASDEASRKSITAAYNNARAGSQKDWDIPMQGLAQDVQNTIDNYGVGSETHAVPSAIVANLKKFGILADDTMTQKKVFNYEAADQLLKQINDHSGGMPNKSLGDLHKAVKAAILTAGGPGDPFAVPRKMAAERFALHDAAPALEAVVQGRVAPDDFVQKYIIGGKVNELKKLVEVMDSDSMAEARKQVAQVIYRGAFRGNAAGDKLASPAGLQDAMRQIGQDKLKVFFTADQVNELNRLTRITANANSEPAWGTVARGGNPGGVLFGQMAGIANLGRGAAAATPLLNLATKSSQVSQAMNTTLPKPTNLSPAEIANLTRSINVMGIGAGGLLAPGPQ